MLNKHLIKFEQTFDQSVLTRVTDPLLDQYNIELRVKRDDLLHPVMSGNKWRKLKYILDHALSMGAARLVSMGGAYSNHLHALAYIGNKLGLSTVGIIRGERLPDLNPTLRDIQDWGMQLEFVTRKQFKTFRQYKQWDDAPGKLFDGYWIAEGGASKQALKGLSDLAGEIGKGADMICVPCGTGTTVAGIVSAISAPSCVLGFAALKGAAFLERDIAAILQKSHSASKVRWRIEQAYHFGGFARTNQALLAFIDDFTGKTSIPLEPVYTGKMFYGIYDMIVNGKIKAGQRIVAVHTGGLQGARGLILETSVDHGF